MALKKVEKAWLRIYGYPQIYSIWIISRFTHNGKTAAGKRSSYKEYVRFLKALL
jgi:hypothetical protein